MKCRDERTFIYHKRNIFILFNPENNLENSIILFKCYIK